MFTLNDMQRALLATGRAWRDEGERRFDHWSRREALQEATEAFGQALDVSGLRSGRPLDAAARAGLLRLAATLAPNPHLSRRLTSADPADFDGRLRELFYGQEPLEARLRRFLTPRGTGALTAAQMLSAFAPDRYPLVTRPALRRLCLTSAQKREALGDAAGYFGFEISPAPDAAQRLLALFIVYEAVRDALGVASYPEVDDLLRAPWSSLSALGEARPAERVREPRAVYGAEEPPLTETRLLAALEDFAAGQGFTFPPRLLRSYYIALKTKPFAILSGISGTGKTKMAELFAETLTGQQPAQFRLIPVRPDWADSTALFGYQNVLANRYVSTPFLEIAHAAALPKNRGRAYFICLDEMNLARVEHYFADYLSALESRTHRIPLHEDVPDLVLPPNLFVTGTVNVDEATHAFSRKVLDRANTLDFDVSPILLASGGFTEKGAALLHEGAATPAQRQALFLTARVASIGRGRERLSQIDSEYPNRALTLLQGLNDRLTPHRFHFAYRVRDEILMFLANSFDQVTNQGLLHPDIEDNFRIALDMQVRQKVLPKLSGVAEMLDPLLAELQAWAMSESLPQTAAKLTLLRQRGAATGYVHAYE